jgi:signal transduction histidine kinase
MQESRPLIGSVREQVRLRRSKLLNASLLVIGSLMGVSAGANIALQYQNEGFSIALTSAVLLLVGAAWLIVAYILSRRRYLRVAGMMVVVLVIAVLALLTYLVPTYTQNLLPFTALPVVLAALLIGHRSPYFAAFLTIIAIIGAIVAQTYYPAPEVLVLPPPDLASSVALTTLALFLLALTLAPLRGEVARLFSQVQRDEIAQWQANQGLEEAKQAREQALAHIKWQQQHADRILARISDGALAVNEKGVIHQANQAARRLWSEVVGGDLLSVPFDQVKQALGGSTPANQYVEIVPLGDTPPDGLRCYTHILLDRRERARYIHLRSELMNLLASEMRNPLTSMVTALEMTLGQNLPEGADRVLVGARRSGQRLLDLVTTMLEIDQIERDPSILQRSITQLRPVIEAGIAQTAPLAQQSAVTTVVEYSGDGPVLIDAERLSRAFVYLLETALRHSPPYSTVQVRIERPNGSLVVRISDQGAGFTPEQRATFFEQGGGVQNRAASPLGLAFSKLLIETHGGRIWVESAESSGTTYIFTLPVVQQDIAVGQG